ncbi:MAG: formylglycine-generating enzyme family protein [Nitrosomonadales bacterium]|nr:formylglycine-generating enzyme family protein [Nitrosomonadales bacterium]
MTVSRRARPVLTAEERIRRKRYLSATLITCVVLALVGGSLHVVKLGANRMADMRKMATYDLKEENSRIRAAGEDIVLHEKHEANKSHANGYSVDEAERLLSKDEWQELESMVPVPAGPFLMGTNLDRADEQDKPQHTVTLPAYVIDKYLVTNAQYARFVAATGHRPPLNWKDGQVPQGELMRPVTMVTWYDAKAYAKWAGKRLPTEAEWEKAARGTDGRRWPWGNKMEPERLNTYYNVGSATNVNAYPNGASPYGALDMAGNMDEWMADEFAPYPGSKAPSALFQGKVAMATSDKDQAMKVADMVPTEGKYKTLRGGSWKGDPFSTATYHRDSAWANYASDFYGFRCAGDVRQQAKGK